MRESGIRQQPPPPVHPGAVTQARNAVARVARETPLVRSQFLSEHVGAAISLKLENLQITGSFKVRGAANKLLSLGEEERDRGVVTCSSGNHGRALSFVASVLGISATVCVPEWVDPIKLEAIRRHGAEAVLHGSTYDEAEQRSIEVAEERGLTYLSPFDDPFVIAGQGTIGLELLEQAPQLDTVVIPLSGGGLAGGVALALKAVKPEMRVIGASAHNARVMFESLKAGKPIAFPEEETIANALSGGIGLNNRYTFQLVRDFVDEHVLVSEEEIRQAMRLTALEEKVVVEGGGAVGIAALLSGKVASLGNDTVVIVSGGNVSGGILGGVLAEEDEASS